MPNPFDTGNADQTTTTATPPAGGAPITPPAAGAPPPAGGEGAPVTPSAAAPALTREDIANITRSAVEGVVKGSAAPPAEKKMTKEELDKMFNVFQPTAKEVEDIQAGGEQAVAALHRIAQGASRQSVTMAQYLMENFKSEIMKQLMPHMEFSQRAQEEMLKQEFFADNKDLVGYEPILTDIKIRMEKEGFKGTKTEVFKKLAEEAKKTINLMAGKNGAPPNGGGAASAGPAKPTTNRMTTLSTGGQGGAGGSGGSGGSGDSTAKRIFS